MLVEVTSRDPLLPLVWLGSACPSLVSVQPDVLVCGAVVRSGELGLQLQQGTPKSIPRFSISTFPQAPWKEELHCLY